MSDTANDNDSTPRYTIRRSGLGRCWRPHEWHVYDGNRVVSIGFATYKDAVSCVAALEYCDRRWPARAVW